MNMKILVSLKREKSLEKALAPDLIYLMIPETIAQSNYQKILPFEETMKWLSISLHAFILKYCVMLGNSTMKD